MSDRLIDLLLRLAPRERMLLGLLAGLVLPVALALGWLWPLHEERQAAQGQLREARALDAWVLDRRDEIAQIAQPVETGGEIPSAVGASALEQSLIARNLRDKLRALETRDEGEIDLRFDAVKFTELMRWIDAEDPDWGYNIAVLSLERTERDALVGARLTLVPAAP